MPVTKVFWKWEEAFDKFGFGDGDGVNFTDEVANVLTGAGFTVVCDTWGTHNYLIMGLITTGGTDLLKNANVGYDDPRKYLPENIVSLLDEAFPNDEREEKVQMPARKRNPPAPKQVVLQLYNCGADGVVALLVDEVLVAFNSTIRVKLPDHDDPLFLKTADDLIIYRGIRYSDFSVSTVEEAREWLGSSGIPITPFDPNEAWE